MATTRRRFTAQFKAQVAMEALRGDRTIRAIGSPFPPARPAPRLPRTVEVLLALGLDPEVAASGVRISLGRFTTDDDVREACRVLTALPAGTVELPA